MSDKTKIEWADATANYVNGCSVVSPGCTNCYAMKLAGARMRSHPSRAGLTVDSKAGPVWTGEVRQNAAVLRTVLGWKAPRRIFWNAHGDLFHPNVPDAWIDQQFAVMALTPQHTHMVLTKRPERMLRYMLDRFETEYGSDNICEAAEDLGIPDPMSWPQDLPNVWLGTSVEDQARADERIPQLLATPAAKRFISFEPLLGPVKYLWPIFGPDGERLLHMAIVGGESGKAARPMHPDWVRGLRDDLSPNGVAFFFKQWGEWAPMDAAGIGQDGPVTDRKGNVRDWMHRYIVAADGSRGDRVRAHSFTGHATDLVYRIGKKRAGNLLDGRQHLQFPA